jgi:hypothetical protein
VQVTASHLTILTTLVLGVWAFSVFHLLLLYYHAVLQLIPQQSNGA